MPFIMLILSVLLGVIALVKSRKLFNWSWLLFVVLGLLFRLGSILVATAGISALARGGRW